MRTAGSRFDATSFIVAEKTPETHEARDVAMLEAQVLNGNKNEFYFIIFFEWGTMYGGGLRWRPPETCSLLAAPQTSISAMPTKNRIAELNVWQ